MSNSLSGYGFKLQFSHQSSDMSEIYCVSPFLHNSTQFGRAQDTFLYGFFDVQIILLRKNQNWDLCNLDILIGYVIITESNTLL